MSGKEKLQTALRCIQIQIGAVTQVLERDDPGRLIPAPLDPVPGPPNWVGCEPLPWTRAGFVTVAELRTALGRIDALANALRGAIDPLPREPLSGTLFAPDMQALIDSAPPEPR